MPIQPVSGEIKAQPINDNFSYLDSKTNNISKGSPSGAYATIAALKAAYPNGNTNMYVVTADGKWYYWSGTDWTAGGVYQSQGIADDQVSFKMVQKNLVNVNYTRRKSELPKFIAGKTTHELYLSIGDLDYITWPLGYYWIPQDTVVVYNGDNPGSTMYDLLFNYDSKVFRLVPYNNTRESNELYVTTLSKERSKSPVQTGSNNFMYQLGNENGDFRYFPDAKIVPSDRSKNIFSIDYTNKKLGFLQNFDVYSDKTITSITAKNTILDITDTLDPSKTSLWILALNIKTSVFSVLPYTSSLTLTDGNYWKLTMIKRIGNTLYFGDNLPKIDNPLANPLAVIPPFEGYFEVSKKNWTMTLKVNGSSDFLFYYPSGYEAGTIKNGMVINIPRKSEIASSALLLFYDFFNKKFVWQAYTVPTVYPQNISSQQYQFVGGIRRDGNDADGITSFSATLPIPWEFSGKINGIVDQNTAVEITAPVKMIFHRGYSLKYPENTELAYIGAKRAGVNEVELDINWTSDLVPVNLHDGTINRTARNLDGTAIETADVAINSLTYEEASAYDYGIWKDPSYSGQKLMTIEDCVLLAKTLGLRLHLDRSWQMDETKLEIVAQILDKHHFNKPENILWYVDEGAATIERIRNRYPDARLYILHFNDITDGAINLAKQYDADDARCIIFAKAGTATSEAQLQKALDAGCEVHMWGTDNLTTSQLSDLIKKGVSGISNDGYNYRSMFFGKW